MTAGGRLVKIRRRIWEQQGRRCHYCEKPLEQFEDATTEHVVPKAFGGTDAIHNLVVGCRDCNNERGHGLVHCRCHRCKRAIELFLQAKAGQRTMMDRVVYVGDRMEVATVIRRLEHRRDQCLHHSKDEELDEITRAAVYAAAAAYNQCISMLTRPVEGPDGDTEGRGLETVAEGVAYPTG